MDRAEHLCRRTRASDPNNAEAQCNLGIALAARGETEEAIAACRRAIAIKPDQAAAYDALANILRKAGKFEEAAACLRQAIAVHPNIAEWHSNLGVVLHALGKPNEAVAACRRAIALKPSHAKAYGALASAQGAMGELAEAVVSLQHAVALDPNVADWHCNLGDALAALGRPDDAVGAYRRAIALKPDHADAHGGLSLRLLTLGNLRQGFEEYRWRWQVTSFPETMPVFSCPLWEGESLAGRTIVVHCEQGFGDAIQFIRYVPLLLKMAAHVAVQTDEALAGLFRSIAGIEVLTTQPEGYDYHVPLMCLPRLFATTLDTIPADVPYLAADPRKAARWAARLSSSDRRIKVGLVWAGGTDYRIDSRRSVSLQLFAPLAALAHIRFFSLQKGEAAAQTLRPPEGLQLIDLTSELIDFEDTASVIVNLDLVISVDTAVVHLAGALAKPVWVLSRYNGCWRWLNGRDDSPWYPTARLFHQKAGGAWDEVVERVTIELGKLKW